MRVVAALRKTKTTMVNAAKRGLSTILPYRPMNGSREHADAKYAKGDWDYLRGLNERARFSVVAGYCHHLKEYGSILEVGCGEGILQERLSPTWYSRFVGVDISAEAIRRAARKQNATTIFVTADASTYEPEEEFDLIVFNECLEYFHDPLSIVRRYDRFLKADGRYIVSMFDSAETAQTRRIWKTLASVYRAEIATRVSNNSGYAWIIKVLARPPVEDRGPKQRSGMIPDMASGRQIIGPG